MYWDLQIGAARIQGDDITRKARRLKTGGLFLFLQREIARTCVGRGVKKIQDFDSRRNISRRRCGRLIR
jgi:hypothetical protein